MSTPFEDLTEAFKRSGMSTEMSKLAAAGRDGVPDGLPQREGLEAQGRALGLNEAGARQFAADWLRDFPAGAGAATPAAATAGNADAAGVDLGERSKPKPKPGTTREVVLKEDGLWHAVGESEWQR